MRKLVTIAMIGCLTLAVLPAEALAGGHHAATHVWTGVGIGVAAATLAGFFFSAVPAPVIATPPLTLYTSPPVMYAPVPPVVYSSRPVVVYRGWVPPGHWKHHRLPRYERH
jgi:hypothetical protein